ncbi:MAG: putative prophage repressor protein [bacterium]|nr:putative prophage repressor protein [bacterium]
MAKTKTVRTPQELADAARLREIFERRKKESGHSQEGFGETHNIGTQGMVWQYLNGSSKLNVIKAAKFANALRVKIDDFSPTLAAIGREIAAAVRSEELRLTPTQVIIARAYGNAPPDAQKTIFAAASPYMTQGDSGRPSTTPAIAGDLKGTINENAGTLEQIREREKTGLFSREAAVQLDGTDEHSQDVEIEEKRHTNNRA